MASRKVNKSSETYLSAGTDIYLSSLQKYVLPSIIKYYSDNYSVENVTVAELAENALKVKLPTEEKVASTPTKEGVRKPKQVDTTNGCQYLLERSRVRGGEVCGSKRDTNGHFCKNCQGKVSFPPKAKAYAEKLGLCFEDVIGDNYVPLQEKKPKVPAKRGPKAKEPVKSKVPVSKPGYKSKVVVESDDEEDDLVVEEELHIEGEPIEGLKDILYEARTNIVFCMADDNPEGIVAFGQWTEDGKISRLTEAMRITAKQYEMKIGRYEDYDIGKYSVNYVEKVSPRKSEKNKENEEDDDDDDDEDDDEEEDENLEVKPNTQSKVIEPERPKPEERLHAIPNRRTITRK